jgi:drug/metabolite transporter (DMT)-like permease
LRIGALISKLRSLAFLVVLILGISFSLEQQAHAYVDPGSGLVLFQSLGAIFTGGLFYFRRRLKLLFTREKEKTPDSELS